MRLNKTSAFSSIKLGEEQQVPREVQVLRTGKFNHPKYGPFEITPHTLMEMKANFDNRARGIDLAFDYFHESDKEASAWVQHLELRDANTELWAVVEWTPKAQQKLAEKELRYFSPDFAFQWTDPETNVQFNNVLFGGGLTNRPFVKEMKPILANENTGDQMNLEQAQARVKELESANLKLSEDVGAAQKEKEAMEKQMADMPKPDKVAALEQQIAALQAELAKAKSESEAAMAEKKKLEDAQVLAEKTNEFNALLSEGKACAAQKEAFMKGDMKSFIALAEPVNMRATGSSSSQTPTPDGDVTAILKLAEEKKKADPKLSHGDAVSMAKRELKK